MKHIFILTLIFISLSSFSQNKLLVPDILEGSHIDLSLRKGIFEIYPGYNTHTIGYNQEILGPTIILEKGQEVFFKVTNYLDEATTLHWHGLHVSSENDGGPHTVINPGEIWEPSFTILDQAATYWYHPHLHENTEQQVTRGAAGFIIVKDEVEASLELPRTYGVDDFPIVIQSRAFDENKQLVWNTAEDDLILANATIDAFLEVPAQVVRLRLLNGSTERVYNLGFEGGFPFYQIAGDGGLLNAPVELSRLQLVPGERAEILVDLSNFKDQAIEMMSFASEIANGYYGASSPGVMPMGSIPGYNQNVLNGTDFEILELRVTDPNSQPVSQIPQSLIVNVPYLTNDVDQARALIFRPKQMGPTGMLNGPFTINGVSFDMDVVNYEIPLWNTEIWELTNMTAIAHPFHIHDVQFYILDINGNPPPANMLGRKDVVMVPPMGGRVRFITRFEDFANDEVPYMYHCHMLSHEDEGMMGQFIVKDFTSNTNETADSKTYIYPNPSKNRISFNEGLVDEIKIYKATGELVEVRKPQVKTGSIDISHLEGGAYYLHLTNNGIINKLIFIKI